MWKFPEMHRLQSSLGKFKFGIIQKFNILKMCPKSPVIKEIKDNFFNKIFIINIYVFYIYVLI